MNTKKNVKQAGRVPYWIGQPTSRAQRALTYLYKETRAFAVMTPLDRIYHILTKRSDYPPWSLKESAGNRGYTFEASGREALIALKLLGALKPGDKMLEIGCGPGKMALTMIRDGVLYPQGEYFGTDLQQKCISWAQKNISSKYPNCHFLHVNRQESGHYVFPFDDNIFDLSFLHSVFTHTPSQTTLHYLKEIARVLKEGGRCLATFILITDHNKQYYNLTGKGISNFVQNGWAYEETFLRELIDEASLKIISPIHYGQRSSRPSGLMSQDLIVMEK